METRGSQLIAECIQNRLRYRSGISWRFKLLVFSKLLSGSLFLFVMVDNVLVGRTALFERVQIVHVVHVSPQVNKRFGYLEPGKIFA